jgi:hypothetical protein
MQQGGGIIDASITPTARELQGKSADRLKEHPDTPPTKEVKPGVDQEARWVKKGSKLQYGYKHHYLAAEDTGLVLAVHTTAANVPDSQCISSCLDQVELPSESRILADKGHCSAKNGQLLRQIGLRSGIQRKAYRHKSPCLFGKSATTSLLVVVGFQTSRRVVLLGMGAGAAAVSFFLFVLHWDEVICIPPSLLANLIVMLGAHHLLQEKGRLAAVRPRQPAVSGALSAQTGLAMAPSGHQEL